MGDIDIILTLAAPGEAPSGLSATGDPVFNRIWTLLGLPCIGLPCGVGPLGLPLAVQLVGPRGGDRQLLAAAAWVEGVMRQF
jgi:Asp-tRNA(Asn)/Glu-tRNA(Gln) amidotransferase A subunit family amidase